MIHFDKIIKKYPILYNISLRSATLDTMISFM